MPAAHTTIITVQITVLLLSHVCAEFALSACVSFPLPCLIYVFYLEFYLPFANNYLPLSRPDIRTAFICGFNVFNI